MRAKFILRLRIIAVAVILLAVFVVSRLYFLQIAHGKTYREEANAQYRRSTRALFERGTIYFTKKDGNLISAASLRSGYILAINPSKIENVDTVFNALSKYIELDKDNFYKRASKKDDPYEEIAKHIDKEVVSKIREKDLKGVQFFKEKWRYYPGGRTASNVLGFVGYSSEGDTVTGQYGLERYWNSVLTRNTDKLRINFFAEMFADTKEDKNTNDDLREGDIVTTIEPAVQQTLDRVVAKTKEEWGSKEIGGIIMNPENGDIYAMSTLPSFNPNSFSDEKNARVFRNPFVEDVYEMGSIIKPIAMAIGLDVGAVTRNTTYNDTGTIMIDKSKISNYDGRARGVVDMEEVLKQSLNVGMAFVADKVGGKVMGKRMKEFGFGEETGIDLPFEVRGLINNLDSPRKVEYATAAFGQGIALTPIATVRALSALGNGGYLVTPHFVNYIKYADGEMAKVAPDDKVQVLKKETSKKITDMLIEVVDVALRNGTVKKDRYSIAAKTGTAQIAKVKERGYYDDRYLHSFFGYFPAHNPKYIIFLFHVEPHGARYASQTLTTPFMELVDFLINYYNVPPDR